MHVVFFSSKISVVKRTVTVQGPSHLYQLLIK